MEYQIYLINEIGYGEKLIEFLNTRTRHVPITMTSKLEQTQEERDRKVSQLEAMQKLYTATFDSGLIKDSKQAEDFLKNSVKDMMRVMLPDGAENMSAADMMEEAVKAIIKDVQIGILTNVKTRQYTHTFERCNKDIMHRVTEHYTSKGYVVTCEELQMCIRW